MFAHIDADAFFASVLVRQNPKLKGKPLLAMGMGGGCVISASYEAKAKGVKTGMRYSDAKKLCPGAIAMNSDFAETGMASGQIETILQNHCPHIEQMSIDEWFLDLRTCVGGVPSDLTQWGKKTREEILKMTAISCSVGVGPSKLLAKMASEFRKPGGITILTPPCGAPLSLRPVRPNKNRSSESLSCPETNPGEGEFCFFTKHKHSPSPGRAHDQLESQNTHHEKNGMALKERGLGGEVCLDIKSFLEQRPTAAIPGIGRKRTLHTDAHGWVTAWDYANAPSDTLRKLFGRPGVDLKRELLGEPLSQIVTNPEPPKSVSRARSFTPTADQQIIWAHALRHLEYLVLKMRRHDLACRGLSVWLRNDTYDDFRGANRSLPCLTDTEGGLRTALTQCFEELYRPMKRYTQVGVALWRLSPRGSKQLSLLEDPRDVLNDESLQESLDELHERYGRNSITHASAIPVASGTKMKLELSVYE